MKAPYLLLSVLLLLLFVVSPRAFGDYPIVAHRYLADPGAMVSNGRVYVYCSNDDDNPVAGGYSMKSIVCVSSSDLKNWTDHGEVFRVPTNAAWANYAWAPAAIERNGQFHLYFANNASGIGVATSASPTGPFVDAKGGYLISSSTPGVLPATNIWIFDPAVFIDDDGQAYLYFGGNAPDNIRVIRLNSDMISTSGSAITLSAPSFFEAAWMHKRNGLYYFSYSTNTAGGLRIDYLTSSSPTSGFTYRGVVAGQPPSNNNNNHASIFQLNGQWYHIYHNRSVATQAGIATTYRRNLAIESLGYNADGTIQPVTYTTDGVSQVGALNPFVRVEAETMSAQSGIKTEVCVEGGMNISYLENGGWMRVRGVDFGAAGARSFSARVASGTSGGAIELRLDSPAGQLVGTCAVAGTGGSQTWTTRTCAVSGATGIRDLYLKFAGSSGSLLNINWWQFSASTGGTGGVTVTGNVAPGSTSWAGTPIAASVSNPSGETSIAEGFGGTASSYTQTFTVPVTSSYVLDRICLYVGGGTGTSGSAPLTINLFDFGGQSAPNPPGYLAATSLLGGVGGLSINYTTQANGVLQLDFAGSDRVTLVAGRLYAFEISGFAGSSPMNWLRGTTDTYTGGAAYRNRAWINGSNARDFAMAVYGSPTATPPTASTINAAVTHQTIDGFGAGAAYLDAGIRQLTAAQMDALYGTGPNQMALNLIRVRISPGGISDWGDQIANGQKAHLRGAKILATPWTPPTAMKDSGVIHTGSLLPSQYQNYVDYLNFFTDTMATSGAPVAVVSLQNEADYDPVQEYDACIWTAAQFVTFCRDFAGAIKVPVMMPESYGFKQALSDPALNDAAAAANIDYIGGHLYGATITDYPLAHARGKHTWMTEYLENDQTIQASITTAKQIQDCLTVGNMSAYIWWKTIGNANGLLDATGVLQKRAFVMGQFSRFIRPGDVRLDVPTNNSSLAISAFRNSVTGRFAIVAVNNTGAAVNHTFNLQGLGAISVTPWVTSAGESLAVQMPVAVNGGSFSYPVSATTIVTFVGEASPTPVIVAAPESKTVAAGATLTLTAVAEGMPVPTYQWRYNGVNLVGATAASLTVSNFQPANAGLYTALATNANGAVTSDPAIVGVFTTGEVIGAGTLLQPTRVLHPNGNVFDQILLTGVAETITAVPGQVARTSFVDLTDDIVQVEFSGAGTLSLVLDDSTGPAQPLNYNQPTVSYMKGHARVVISGADETTNVSVFTVGRATAFDPTGGFNILLPVSATNNPANNDSALFVGHGSTLYDGVADIAFIAISSANGKFGGVRAANASCFATQGHTGIYAPGVQFTGPVFIGDINASSAATPVFVIGSSPDTRITGGDLLQANGMPVKVSGITQLTFTAGSTSRGAGDLPAQTNKAVLLQNGVDVTAQIVVNPGP